jgi:hypothetical protein
MQRDGPETPVARLWNRIAAGTERNDVRSRVYGRLLTRSPARPTTRNEPLAGMKLDTFPSSHRTPIIAPATWVTTPARGSRPTFSASTAMRSPISIKAILALGGHRPFHSHLCAPPSSSQRPPFVRHAGRSFSIVESLEVSSPS